MDFFDAQEAARRRTGMLVALFLAAVVAIIAVVYTVARFAFPRDTGVIDVPLLLQVAGGVGVVIGLGSATRIASLRRGGPAVAELLGARRIAPDTDDLDERKFVNVVEEMAIASGTPVPAIYVMDGEDGINAFAAGYTPHDAAVAVTRGALRVLTRDELQGVIAHEFSHILNGDMRLNIRLIGILYGILLLAVIGRGILHLSPRSGGGRKGGRDSGGAIVLIGLAMFVVGYIGVFFGKLIKAAVSRQREYLADAAAVEFTRNPDGLAGALKKIGGAQRGSRIQDHHAEELSHLFFASGVGSAFASFLSTHPPLEERIQRLDPSWDGTLIAAEPATGWVEEGAVLNLAGTGAPAGSRPTVVERADPAAERLVDSIGSPTPGHLAYASALLASLPRELERAAHTAAGAPAVLFALLLSACEEHGIPAGIEAIRSFGRQSLEERILQLLPHARTLAPEARLPLLDLTLPALDTLSPAEGERLLEAISGLVTADDRLKLFEVAVLHTVSRRLRGPEREDRGGGGERSLSPVRDEVEALLSAVAWAGSGWDPAAASAAFTAGTARLPRQAGELRLADLSGVSVERLDRALSSLQHTAHPVRRRLLEACVATAAHDRRISPVEMEMLRAVSEALDCPMPPLLA